MGASSPTQLATIVAQDPIYVNFNVNERNSNTTFTNTIVVRGSDGSTIKLHDVSHVTYNGNGVITVTFDKPSLTCG